MDLDLLQGMDDGFKHGHDGSTREATRHEGYTMENTIYTSGLYLWAMSEGYRVTGEHRLLAEADRAFASLERQEPGRSDPSARRSSFSQVEETMTETAAKMEALRCICCDSRLEIRTITLPPRKESLLELNPNTVETVPETEGVYQLMDADKGIIAIKGVINLREALLQEMEDAGDIRYFVFEEDPMYTKRESELIQKYLQEHGELPGGGADELDDLF